MRLSKIRLAGFKSFVDPTSINLPGPLTGIVGPNGCGKSNTIDAVRWVMGESSAKHLRGESMDDVIFTGSSTRKPVSQASVELVFDNSDGSLGGEYAAYSEIALRREVTRDGQSKYMLNNSRCRRRDIRDIFLGTGLGPRSYAIIEQGMISRLIEAKPEELRVYLEEAAGISKYKERRRETENRIRHTRDNLDRLDDLREEVDKQLAHLKRQANTAERYKVLKEEERDLRGQLLGLRWLDYHGSIEGRDASIREKEVSLEEIIAEQRSIEASIEEDRQNHTDATEDFNRAQADYYQLGSEVSRVEQSIQHTRESREQQNNELRQIEQSLAEAEKHIREDEARIQEIDATMADDEPAFDQLQESQKFSAESLAQSERQLQEWQGRWDAWSARNNETTQTAQVELSRMDQLERGISQLDSRIERLVTENASLDIVTLSSSIEEWIAREVELVADEEGQQAKLDAVSSEIQSLRESQQSTHAELDDVRGTLQSSLGRLASLEALQQAALGQNDQHTADWLAGHNLAERPRVGQKIRAESGWEKAVEVVLGHHLEAICVDGLDALTARLDGFGQGRLAFFDGTAAPTGGAAATGRYLIDHVQSELPLADLLAGVRCAESLAEALAQRSSLGAGESIVTRDGMWLGASWLRIGEADVKGSVLQREQEIEALRESISSLEAQSEKLEQRIATLNEKLSDQESRRETLQHSFNQLLRESSEVKSQLVSGKQQLEQLHSRAARLAEETEENRQLKQQDEEQVRVSRARRAEALDQIDGLTAEGDALRQEQEALKEEHAQARERAEADRNAGQELAIRVESMRNVRSTTQANLERTRQQTTQFSTRREELVAIMAANEDDPVVALEASLAELLEAHVASETSLNVAREALEQVDTRLRAHEQSRLRQENRAASVRETLQAERMESQEVRVRLKTIEEQLVEHEYDREVIIESMPEEAQLSIWTEKVEELERKIQRLGPINLAAIDEFDEQMQRKEYLDSQHTDVTDALSTLEKAIAKIDRETRERFRDTFDKVNTKVQDFFPRLFGGGQANLEMTGDDLLNTGVTVLAQPPGKHVTNIHLLSGGEKALTAVALVFAFFELNPSPFCMLDEVDAPLDDANVGRFCQLVKEMSERVQFIFITHNKVTMELARQLMGVTMNEPGVSRLVAVDVQEAVELAGA
ncbi:MAG: chromosome segregation protein SMC [Gammaproteobacteria bacterium]|nr:chromosome segregation protein SMC [Gammaproteobacteria bacterium]